jgi:uncharacterized membrane protein
MKAPRVHKTNETRGKEPTRLIFLSDGLFATVLTLLVLDLRIPEALNSIVGGRTAIIRWLGPHLFSYVLTFLVAGSYWRAHHRDFEAMVGSDRGLVAYNLLFLLFIGLLPFSTATISLGNYQGNDFPFYWAIYATNIILAGVMLELAWNYAVSHGLVTEEMTPEQNRYISLHQLATPSVFLVSIAVEYIFPQFFLGPYTLLVIPLVIWLIDRKFAGKDRYPRRMEKGEPAQPAGWRELLWRAGTILPWLLIIGLAVWATVY